MSGHKAAFCTVEGSCPYTKFLSVELSSRRGLERCHRTVGHFLVSKENSHRGSLFSSQSHCLLLLRHAFHGRRICRG